MRMPWPRGVVAAGVVLALGVSACAGTRAARGSRALGARQIVAGPRTIVSSELSPWPDVPLDETLLRVRPDVLRRSFREQPVAVYVDRMPSSFAELHALLSRQVGDVHLLTLMEAQLEYGPFIMQPVLDVRLRHDVVLLPDGSR